MAKFKQPMLVRIKPRGTNQPQRRYTVHGIRFDEARGWYRVDAHVAEYVEQVREHHEDPTSAPLFDVCTKEQAAAIDKRERDAKLADGKARALDPVVAGYGPRDVTSAAREPVEARAGAKHPPHGKPAPEPPPEGGDLTPEDLARGTSRARPAKRERSMRAAAPGEA